MINQLYIIDLDAQPLTLYTFFLNSPLFILTFQLK